MSQLCSWSHDSVWGVVKFPTASQISLDALNIKLIFNTFVQSVQKCFLISKCTNNMCSRIVIYIVVVERVMTRLTLQQGRQWCDSSWKVYLFLLQKKKKKRYKQRSPTTGFLPYFFVHYKKVLILSGNFSKAVFLTFRTDLNSPIYQIQVPTWFNN